MHLLDRTYQALTGSKTRKYYQTPKCNRLSYQVVQLHKIKALGPPTDLV